MKLELLHEWDWRSPLKGLVDLPDKAIDIGVDTLNRASNAFQDAKDRYGGDEEFKLTINSLHPKRQEIITALKHGKNRREASHILFKTVLARHKVRDEKCVEVIKRLQSIRQLALRGQEITDKIPQKVLYILLHYPRLGKQKIEDIRWHLKVQQEDPAITKLWKIEEEVGLHDGNIYWKNFPEPDREFVVANAEKVL